MDKPVLKNDIMADGSRLFLQLPQTCPPSRLMSFFSLMPDISLVF